MYKIVHKINELEQSKAFFEDAEKNMNEKLNAMRKQGKQGTPVYLRQKKLYLKTIKALVDIRRFLRQWDKMPIEHV